MIFFVVKTKNVTCSFIFEVVGVRESALRIWFKCEKVSFFVCCRKHPARFWPGQGLSGCRERLSELRQANSWSLSVSSIECDCRYENQCLTEGRFSLLCGGYKGVSASEGKRQRRDLEIKSSFLGRGVTKAGQSREDVLYVCEAQWGDYKLTQVKDKMTRGLLWD